MRPFAAQELYKRRGLLALSPDPVTHLRQGSNHRRSLGSMETTKLGEGDGLLRAVTSRKKGRSASGIESCLKGGGGFTYGGRSKSCKEVDTVEKQVKKGQFEVGSGDGR